MLAIDILRIYFPKTLGVLRGNFGGFGCLKDTQTDALLVKTNILDFRETDPWGLVFALK